MLICCKCAFSQIDDNFADGDFNVSPTWNGLTSTFKVNSTQQLQTVSITAAQTVYLSTENQFALNVKWQFLIRMDFDPSTTNQLKIYLISDKSDLKSALNGYFIQIGESGTTDSYDLYKQTGTTITKIIEGAAKSRANTSQVLTRFEVSRTSTGEWDLKTDITGGTNFVSEGRVTDNTYTSTGYFGFQCKYTASRSASFFFDDVKVQKLAVDNQAPKIVSAAAIDSASVEIEFDEALDSASAKANRNYLLNGVNPIKIASTDDPAKYHLLFSKSLETASYVLAVSNVHDLSGNVITANSSISFTYIKPYTVKPSDVVINEIFADPNPQIDLPGLEFIELWNITDKDISLKGWAYSDVTSKYIFGNSLIKAGEYLILCAKADTNEFKSFGKSLGISPWPSLNNSGDVLSLKNEKGTIINAVSYADSWYKTAEKKSGGYSLELINPKALCGGIQNWSASSNKSGGTPGRQNSVYDASTFAEPLKLLNAEVLDSVTVQLTFNRFVDSLSLSKPEHYAVNANVGKPTSAKPISPYFEQVILKFASPFVRGNTFTIAATEIGDCSGSLIATNNSKAEFSYLKQIQKGDILINEVLFNPRPNGVDFVEIYNNTDHLLDLKDLKIATIAKDTLSSIKTISDKQSMLPAGAYLVLTTNPENIKEEYSSENPKAFLKIPSMPSYNDDAGTVILLSDKTQIDRFDYSEKMHFKLIKDAEGISLERSSFTKPANEVGNFRSASSTSGFATPGYKNSQFLEPGIDDEFALTSKTFSPDNDGFEDVLQINYKLDQPGMVANLTVYNDQGILIKKLTKNETLNSEGSFIWDGFNETTQKAQTGIYIVYAEFFDAEGRVKKFRKTFALAVKL